MSLERHTLPMIVLPPKHAPGRRIAAFMEHVGAASVLASRSAVTLFTSRFEGRLFLYQMEQLGVRSVAIALATAVFVGIVMAIQFAYALERFGAKDMVGRIVAMSQARELAPALTALVVGCRIAAGMAAEIGSMAVTEQIDAIRALGANPIRKLVVPRVLAGTLIMPFLAVLAFVLSVASAMVISDISFGVPMKYFLEDAINTVAMWDFMSGLGKTPFFGFLVALLGCHFGMTTSGGTEGVGRSTTRAVVVVAVTILVADALLTQIFMAL